MKKGLIIIVIGCLVVAGYFLYLLVLSPSKATNWDFVPEKSALVWEIEDGLATHDSIQQLGIWSAFSELTSLKKLDQYLVSLDESSGEKALRSTFSNAPLLVAICPISATNVDALIVVRLTAGSKSFLKKSVDSYEQKGFSSKGRVYNDFTIQELQNRNKTAVFSYFVKDDYLVGSFTPFLVEDAVRAYNDKANLAFRSSFPELGTLTPLLQDQGNLYVNVVEFTRLIESFFNQKISLPGYSAFLDVNATETSLKISGFTFPKDDFLTSFSGGPVSFELLEIVPNNTAVLKHYSEENMALWRSNLMKSDATLRDASAKIKSEYDVDVDFLFQQIKGEFAVADLEMVGNATPDRVLFFDTENAAEVAAFLKQAATRIGKDSLFVDRVGEYEFVRISDGLFSQAFLGARSQLAEECYYMMYRNYAIFSNSLAQLKRLLQAIETDNTWRKSLRMNSMLDLANREANFSVFVNTPRVWNQLMNELKPEWKPLFLANETGFKSLEYVGIQFSKIDNKFYTSLTAYQPEKPRQPAKVAFGERAALSASIISKPFVVRSHVDQSLEVLVQDSLFQLYHLSSSFDILWTYRLSAPIIGNVQPVDYYSNGKFQYAFVSGKQLYIIDRKGNSLEGFPVKIPTTQSISYFSVVDYDGSKNYRFVCTDADGNIFLLDKAGRGLEGWSPKVAGRSMLTAPEHIRVAGKDAFIILRKTEIDLVSRTGRSYQGFPIDLKENIAGGYFTEATGSFETSKLTTITDDGELIRINFSGRIEFREQLVKNASNTKFALIPDVLDNTFLILKSTDGNWEILDAGGVRLFEKTYGSPSVSAVQFYRYGGDKTLLFVANREEGFLTVFDLNGNSLVQRPLQTKQQASVIYFENQNLYQLYLSNGKNVEKVRIN